MSWLHQPRLHLSVDQARLPVALSMAPPPTRSPSASSSSSPRRRRERRAQDADVRVGEAHGLALAVVVEHPGVVLVHQFRDGAPVVNTVAEAHGDAAAGRRQRDCRHGRHGRGRGRGRRRLVRRRGRRRGADVVFNNVIIIITVVEGDSINAIRFDGLDRPGIMASQVPAGDDFVALLPLGRWRRRRGRRARFRQHVFRRDRRPAAAAARRARPAAARGGGAASARRRRGAGRTLLVVSRVATGGGRFPAGGRGRLGDSMVPRVKAKGCQKAVWLSCQRGLCRGVSLSCCRVRRLAAITAVFFYSKAERFCLLVSTCR